MYNQCRVSKKYKFETKTCLHDYYMDIIIERGPKNALPIFLMFDLPWKYSDLYLVNYRQGLGSLKANKILFPRVWKAFKAKRFERPPEKPTFLFYFLHNCSKLYLWLGLNSRPLGSSSLSFMLPFYFKKSNFRFSEGARCQLDRQVNCVSISAPCEDRPALERGKTALACTFLLIKMITNSLLKWCTFKKNYDIGSGISQKRIA